MALICVNTRLILLVLSISLFLGSVSCRRYQSAELVPIWANRVGPFNNPSEYYSLFTLPYCPTNEEPELEVSIRGSGEALQGYKLRKIPVEFVFRADIAKPTVWCTSNMSQADVDKFQTAIDNQYWFQLFIDDLPVWGIVGEKATLENSGGETKYFLYKNFHFDISYNADQIIEVNLTVEHAVEVKVDHPITFTITSSWVSTDALHTNRWKKFMDVGFFEHQVHWFAVTNSFILAIFLLGLVSVILYRALGKDSKFHDQDEEELGEEFGWKQIHGDVFRSPSRPVLLAALLGTGFQILSLILILMTYSLLRDFNRGRGRFSNAVVLGYVVSSLVGGYSSGAWYLRNGGKNWINTLLYT